MRKDGSVITIHILYSRALERRPAVLKNSLLVSVSANLLSIIIDLRMYSGLFCGRVIKYNCSVVESFRPFELKDGPIFYILK